MRYRTKAAPTLPATHSLKRRLRLRCSHDGIEGAADTKLPLSAGLLLGLGPGGFSDGIVLHQLPLWHNMLQLLVPDHHDQEP
ncbi:DUF2243 domain-containing protein [Neorhizobium sp. DAR64860/K0K1]|uniref:DUF2243 domain-containing protein n=1 Tax=Neorhizobium sp. DAR64860/K0K1 TaxID=3421955 RepID=UPI003D2E2B8D